MNYRREYTIYLITFLKIQVMQFFHCRIQYKNIFSFSWISNTVFIGDLVPHASAGMALTQVSWNIMLLVPEGIIYLR